MFKSAETLDDLMHDVLEELLKLPFDVKPSRGDTSEIFGALLQLKNPRARLSRTETKGKPFSALGELLWYMSKSNKLDFIEYYIPRYADDAEKDNTLHGAYGPRLFNMHEKHDQINRIIDLLKKSPTTRRAVIQLFDASDIEKKYKEIPCTCTLQFVIRNNKLNMFTTMRSNDAYKGLPHDIFCFTMLQEIVARSVGVELGIYNHAVGSLHLYSDKKEKAEQYLREGFQSTKIMMPEMPSGDPWPSIKTILDTESKIRQTADINVADLKVDAYWADLIYLLKIHSHFKNDSIDSIVQSQKEMTSTLYKTYIDFRLANQKKSSQA
jgi:thymidylate synthase